MSKYEFIVMEQILLMNSSEIDLLLLKTEFIWILLTQKPSAFSLAFLCVLTETNQHVTFKYRIVSYINKIRMNKQLDAQSTLLSYMIHM